MVIIFDCAIDLELTSGIIVVHRITLVEQDYISLNGLKIYT